MFQFSMLLVSTKTDEFERWSDQPRDECLIRKGSCFVRKHFWVVSALTPLAVAKAGYLMLTKLPPQPRILAKDQPGEGLGWQLNKTFHFHRRLGEHIHGTSPSIFISM
ncbi:hypothetical protein B0H14DRAFT_2580840 [Mycena olivaceomarginata]|nr:hypothetical protein B0H14DRAFT_2580840 [Mycena olivaceomarginata]